MQAAKLFVVDEFGYGRGFAANRALRIATKLHGVDFHGEGIQMQEPAHKASSSPQDQLYRLNRLNAADQTGQDAKYAGLGA